MSEVGMKASIVDLRYKTNDILKALDRNASVTVLYHGKIKGVIKPVREKSVLNIKDHPFFGMYRESEKTVIRRIKQPEKDSA
jgi:hypothetical protein